MGSSSVKEVRQSEIQWLDKKKVQYPYRSPRLVRNQNPMWCVNSKDSRIHVFWGRSWVPIVMAMPPRHASVRIGLTAAVVEC